MSKNVISATAALFAAAVLAGGALAPPATAMSDPKAQSDQTPQQKARKATQKVYCVVEVPTGSHLRTKDCRTREEWIAATGVDPVEVARK